MRGINHAEAWQKGQAETVIPAIAKTGSNTVRISVGDGGNYDPERNWGKDDINRIKTLIKLFTDENDVIIDPCAGSGVTLLAAKQLNRRAYGFEIKKQFVKDFNEKLINQVQLSLITE